MGGLLIPLLLVLPVVELMLLFRIGARIGPPATLIWLLGTFVLGWLVRRAANVRHRRPAEAPEEELRQAARALSRALVLGTAGFLLMVPGLLSDIAGLLLLVPQVRGGLLRQLRRRQPGLFVFSSKEGSYERGDEEPDASSDRRPAPNSVREAEFEVLSDDDPKGDSQ